MPPTKPKLAIILGIRPDVIRASLFLNLIRADPRVEVTFIWSGQHYSDNLKDVFFRELGVKPPEIELDARGSNDAEVSSSIIARLYPVLARLEPDAALFLGDTNTVISCLAAAQLNIPIIHFEGCMRSYDWRMPEEKYRGVIDHLADVIYTYYPEYKRQGVDEGINPRSIVVVTNPIVDVLQKHYFEKRAFYDAMADDAFFATRGIERGNYYVMTCHRRENVHIRSSLEAILALVRAAGKVVYFPASYRTQKLLQEYGLPLPPNVRMVDPVGYQEFLVLMTRSAGVITDSGTVVEETAVLGIPSLQMRRASERPQTYDIGSSVKFDPTRAEKYPARTVFAKLELLRGRKWKHGLGDGHSSERIYRDVVQRLLSGRVAMHRPRDYHLDIRRSYREDGIVLRKAGARARSRTQGAAARAPAPRGR
jgi:UDP-N-acetylglucosamine 2-epimerase (non-hydrolysing)